MSHFSTDLRNQVLTLTARLTLETQRARDAEAALASLRSSLTIHGTLLLEEAPQIQILRASFAQIECSFYYE